MIRGAKPKTQKVTRTPTVHDWIEVDDVPYRGPRPRLPAKMPSATRAWWGDISTMPHCVLWAPTDWRFALDTARVHAAFIAGDFARAGELRIREARMGTTVDARRDLRIRYREPRRAPAPVDDSGMEPVVALMDARRRRLADAD